MWEPLPPDPWGQGRPWLMGVGGTPGRPCLLYNLRWCLAQSKSRLKMVLGQVLGTSCPGSLPSWSVHEGAVFTPNPTSSLIRSTRPPKKAARLTTAVTVHGEPLVWHQATLYSTLHPFCVTIGHRGGLPTDTPYLPTVVSTGGLSVPTL